MAGLPCILCRRLKVTVEVRAIWKGRCVAKADSVRAAERSAIEKGTPYPFLVQHVYICLNCGHEEIKSERYCE